MRSKVFKGLNWVLVGLSIASMIAALFSHNFTAFGGWFCAAIAQLQLAVIWPDE